MKKPMISAIVILTIIILMATFDFSLDTRTPISVPEALSGNALFVCPAANSFWDAMAAGFGAFRKYLLMGFFFGAIILLFMWGWALYQNLLKDEFKKDMYSKPWSFTKLLFWAAIIVILLINTPNRYRRVTIENHHGEWVLCDATSEGAHVVKADLVHAK